VPRFVLSSLAESDIEEILAWTHEQFGEEARHRYERLLVQGIVDVCDDPERSGSRLRPELATDARTYHLHHSRNRVHPSRSRVRQPRHMLVYRSSEDGTVEIGRVLHDSMDLARHLPPDFRTDE
jgi:toxin ParE1/3/4